ncbi:7897_t:CDS:1 [Ambispora gerdemannii]|uniref:7897_t:CDS:1 n=1 Tax=Ambispora gerdemannii TaxID=144530 RepID=A0A9N9EBM7_9GLOM|nr:7897_t:CDS:1 [Ambispora gerdemannii]
MSTVKKAFNEVKQTVIKSRDPNYIQNYLEEWKKDAKGWMHIYTKNYPHMGIWSMQWMEENHNSLKKAIETASSLKQIFSHINRVFRQQQLQMNRAFGLNIVSVDPFIHNIERFEQLLRKISRWTINQIKREICKTEDNDNANSDTCKYSLRLNFKLPCHHIIPSTGSIPLSLVHFRWLLKHDSVPLLSSLSLLTDITISKALYKLEEKYKSLNDCGSKVIFLQKIEALAAKKNVIPKALLRIAPKGRSTSTK